MHPQSWYDGDRLIRMLRFDDVRHNILVTDSYGAQTLIRCNDVGIIVEHVDPKAQTSERILDSKGGVLGTVNADGVALPTSTHSILTPAY